MVKWYWFGLVSPLLPFLITSSISARNGRQMLAKVFRKWFVVLCVVDGVLWAVSCGLWTLCVQMGSKIWLNQTEIRRKSFQNRWKSGLGASWDHFGPRVAPRSVQGCYPSGSLIQKIQFLNKNIAQKVPFWKSRKSKTAPKPPGGGKIGTRTL
jgi:hypothetical protein